MGVYVCDEPKHLQNNRSPDGHAYCKASSHFSYNGSLELYNGHSSYNGPLKR